MALRLANAFLAISCRRSSVGPCFSGLLDGGALLAMLLGCCGGGGLCDGVCFSRCGELGGWCRWRFPVSSV